VNLCVWGLVLPGWLLLGHEVTLVCSSPLPVKLKPVKGWVGPSSLPFSVFWGLGSGERSWLTHLLFCCLTVYFTYSHPMGFGEQSWPVQSVHSHVFTAIIRENPHRWPSKEVCIHTVQLKQTNWVQNNIHSTNMYWILTQSVQGSGDPAGTISNILVLHRADALIDVKMH
jgi:hypothetical protein